MAGTIIADKIQTENAFLTLNVGQTLVATINSSGILNSSGGTMVGANGSVSNTAITGLVTASQIANVANTQITGNITSSQIAPSVTLTTPLISGNLNFDATGTSGIRLPAANTITFHTAGTEDMRITSAGLLGVNANSFPYTEQLRVNFPNTQGLHLNETTNSSSVNYIYLTKGSGPTNVGAAFYNGSSIAWQTTSDYRLKENIVPLTNALDVVRNLKPKSYRWKESQQNDTGFIAHELQALFPQAVSGQKDEVDKIGNPRYQGVDVSFLVATLTAAIQEQQAIISDLKARIEALEA